MARAKPRRLDAVNILPDVIRQLLTIQDPDALLPAVVKLCRNFLSADEVSLLILSPDGTELVEHTVVGAKLRPTRMRIRIGQEGITGWAASKRKTAIIEDVRKDRRYVPADAKRRSEAAVPILSGDRLLGVLNFESNTAGYFKKSIQPLLEFLAAQLAIALRVSDLHEKEDALRDRLAMLHHLSRLSGGFMPADQYLARVADVTRRTLGCYYVGVFQGDYDRQEVVVLAQACAEWCGIQVGASQKFGAGLIGKAFELGEIINARDVTKEPTYLPRLKPVKSEVCVPIRVGDHCIGILDAQGTVENAFTADDLMVLETIARFLVPTVQTAKAVAQ